MYLRSRRWQWKGIPSTKAFGENSPKRYLKFEEKGIFRLRVSIRRASRNAPLKMTIFA
jgi:hypothetical protein